MRSRVATLGVLTLLAITGCFSPSADVEPRTPAEAFASRAFYPEVLIEIDHVPGEAPSDLATSALVSELQRVLEAPVRLTPFGVVPRTPDPLAPYGWTDDELDRIDAATIDSRDPDAFGRGAAAVIHVLILDGYYEDDHSAVGLAGSRTAFLFRGAPTPGGLLPRPETADSKALVERTVLIHEVGHVVGLVNRGVPMVRDHEDPQSRYHSANELSVMHSGADHYAALIATLEAGEAPPWTFDEDDAADLRAYRTR